MAILVLGGAGYIGSHTVYELIDAGRDVVIADNLETGHIEAVHPKAKFYQGDIRNREFVDSVFESEHIDGVIHFAANSLVGESMTNPLKYYDNNLCGTKVLLESMVAHGIDKIVFSSTAATYGEPERVPILETDKTEPTNCYGETKLSMEKMFKWVGKAHGLRFVSLRYFNACGAHVSGKIGEAHNPESHLIPLILQVPNGQREYISIFGDDYDTKDGVFHLWINDRRIFVKGANWGLSEYMLRCRGEEYFTKVRLHKEMNFNMIRNWLGTTTDEEFYEACDKYGIMVWDDFWLNSNPILPDDIHAFNYNAVEKIKRLRNHPSIAVWCGNNEGWPEPPLDTYLCENVRVFDGGERYYQSNSHEGHLSGSGPWGAYDPRYYFTYYPYPYNKVGTPGWGFRTEIGTAVFVNAESFRKFIPEDKLWPRNEMWNLHYFGQQAFNGLPDQYERMLNERYGKAADIDDFCRKAQLLNIESNQALYEGWLDHMWEDASGIMTWMGQSAYPSLVWQTYDYYYDLTGAYWGCKRACEPLHILWNPVTNDVKITNTTSQTYERLTATAEVFNTDGRRVDALTGTATVNSAPNTALRCFTIPFYKNVENIARGKRVVASSTDAGSPEEIVDGSEFTRWGSRYSDHEWIYIDLGSRMNVYGVGLNWENAFGKEFKIQISDDAEHWTDTAHERTGKAGKQDIFFDDVKGRYVKVQGIRRGTGYGYSLYEMKVYGGEEHQAGLSDVHLIRLTLRDAEGRVVDRNTYWRGLKRTDFTALNTLPAPRLKVQQKGRTEGGKYMAEVKVTNLASSPAVSFATWVQLRHPRSGERILPALYDDNYFMLLPGETQTVHVEFDKELLGDAAQPVVSVTPYNDGR